MVDLCIVGTDRTTRSGDVANKIGTYLKALAAKDNGVPFYVALPSTTIDWTLRDGAAIPIEQRAAEEVTEMRGRTADGRIVDGAGDAGGQPGRQLGVRRDPGPAGDGADHRARRVRGQRGGVGGAVFGSRCRLSIQGRRALAFTTAGAAARLLVSWRRTKSPLAMITAAPSSVRGSGRSPNTKMPTRMA